MGIGTPMMPGPGLHEDRSRVRRDLGPANLAILQKLALNAIKSEPTKTGVQRKRNLVGWDQEFLLKLIQHME